MDFRTSLESKCLCYVDVVSVTEYSVAAIFKDLFEESSEFLMQDMFV